MKINNAKLFLGIIIFAFSTLTVKAQTDTFTLRLYLTRPGQSYPAGAFSNIPQNSSPYNTYLVGFSTNCNLTDYAWKPGNGNLNDLANYAMMDASSAGVRFTFYKNANRDLSRGHTIVIAKKAFTGYILTNFESTYEDEYVKVNFNQGYYGFEQMNGEISSVIMEKF